RADGGAVVDLGRLRRPLPRVAGTAQGPRASAQHIGGRRFAASLQLHEITGREALRRGYRAVALVLPDEAVVLHVRSVEVAAIDVVFVERVALDDQQAIHVADFVASRLGDEGILRDALEGQHRLVVAAFVLDDVGRAGPIGAVVGLVRPAAVVG